ncbi:MAG: translocation/assembly module TamB domain-containing protein [Dysgonamonadaceae bacterium]|jgi:hypothetical protein|nr:translocation/assembly module TamB domain-containing protein [Dysgonamonadaceae bacterium]
MKPLKNIAWTVLMGVGLFYIIPLALLQTPYFQQKVSRIATEYLEKKTGAKVEIQQVDLYFLNKLALRNVYLEDQCGDTLLTAKRIIADFDLIPLLQKEFYFTSLHLYTFDLRLSRETEKSPLNIQPFLDAFAGKAEKDDSSIRLSIGNLSLGNGEFSYRVKNKDASPGKFNPGDIHVSNITARIKLDELEGNTVFANVKRLSFNEKSGFQVKNLAFDLAARSGEAQIEQLRLELPHSELNLKKISLAYDSIKPDENRTGNIRFALQVTPSLVCPKDVSPFVPAFSYYRDKLEVKGMVSGTLGDVRLTGLTLKKKKELFLELNADIRHLNQPSFAGIYVNGNIKNMRLSAEGIRAMAHNFSPGQVRLPPPAERLGAVSLNGEISGYLNDLKAFVNLSTEAGGLRAEVRFGKEKTGFLKGKIKSASEINVKRLTNNPAFGTAGFEVDLDATFEDLSHFSGQVDASIHPFEYKSYPYEQIRLSGEFTPNSFKGALNVNTPDGQVAVKGLCLSKGEDSRFDFSAKVSNLKTDKLHLTDNYVNPNLSFSVEADLQGNNPDNLTGSIAFHDLLFSTDKGDFPMRNLSVNASETGNQRLITIHSDIINGKIAGHYAIKTLISVLKQSIASYLPSLIAPEETPLAGEDSHLDIELTINDTQALSSIFELPVTLSGKSRINGTYDSFRNRFRLDAYFPLLNYESSAIEESYLNINNGNDYIEVTLKGTSRQKKNNRLNVFANVKVSGDSIYSAIEWDDNKSRKYKGKLDFTSGLAFSEKKKLFAASFHFQPSELVFNDSVWTLSPADIEYRDNRLTVSNFKANHNRQSITIEGNVSRNIDDNVTVLLENVDLDYIFKSINIKSLTFGGIATGFVNARDVYNTRQLSTHLDITDFAFNDAVFGNLVLAGRWDDKKQGVEMKGNAVKDETARVLVDGFIYPVKEELSIFFDAQNANAAFLRKYLNPIAPGFSGLITGKLHLFGDLNKPTVEGDAWVENGSFGISYLNTTYTFNDWIRCTPDEISLRNATLYDKDGNKALVNASVRHNLFTDFQFSVQVSYEDFLIFNATPQTNPPFYGTVFGTGTASIRGTEALVSIDISMNNTENSLLTFNFMEEVDIADYNFINFINSQAGTRSKSGTEQSSGIPDTGTDIHLTLLVNANNDATLELIMDPLTGDKISATGTGTVQVQYGTKTPLRIIGNYRIERGNYNFSLQQAFYRNFEIEDGSTITLRGDLSTAELNIKAAYTVSANLGDLDQQFFQSASGSDVGKLSVRNNIPVNCVLLLSGPLEHPVIKFDLELPGSTAELERQVKSYIRTDDMLNRQIVYLLVLGRFYTAPEYTRSDLRINNDLSFLTSTLSNQISNMLGVLNNNFRIGTAFHQFYEGNTSNTEVELLLSSTLLDNRLIINGNFGYSNNPYSGENQTGNSIPLVGDFDIEYKLTKNGEIRLKGFNHYNYRNYYSLTPEMTQGFGIVFKRDFNNMKDLFGKRKRLRLIETPEK